MTTESAVGAAGNLRPYDSYKDTGVGWLPSIPETWSMQRNGRLFAQRNETGRPDLPVLEVSLRTGVRIRDFAAGDRKQAIDDRAKYKVAYAGDLAYNMMRMWQGAVGVVPVDGLVSPAYVVARAFEPNAVAYFDAVFHIPAYMREVENWSRGIVPDRNRLYWEAFKHIQTPLPPPEERRRIMLFLEHVNRQIRRYVAANRKLIALLTEHKRTIINRAVTRGLDSSAPLKPTGMDWLGCIPARWNLSRVKNEFLCLNSRRVPLSALERGEMVGRAYDYYGASGVIDKVDDFIFEDELLLIAEDGANLVLRNLPLAIIARGKYWVNNHAHILKPRRGNIEFLAAVMEGLNYEPWISGAAQPKLTKDRLMSIVIAVPDREEQDKIVTALADETREISLALSKAQRQLQLVLEFRARLVADVVTGALDVRESAAHLPNVVGNGTDVAELLDEALEEDPEPAEEEETLA